MQHSDHDSDLLFDDVETLEAMMSSLFTDTQQGFPTFVDLADYLHSPDSFPLTLPIPTTHSILHDVLLSDMGRRLQSEGPSGGNFSLLSHPPGGSTPTLRETLLLPNFRANATTEGVPKRPFSDQGQFIPPSRSWWPSASLFHSQPSPSSLIAHQPSSHHSHFSKMVSTQIRVLPDGSTETIKKVKSSDGTNEVTKIHRTPEGQEFIVTESPGLLINDNLHGIKNQKPETSSTTETKKPSQHDTVYVPLPDAQQPSLLSRIWSKIRGEK